MKIAALFLCLLFAFFITAVFSPGNMEAMSWPTESAVLVRNFGSNNNGKPVLGMIFSGETEVLAVDRGEIIFSRNREDAASRLPSPLGAWTAVDHGDGLISIYSRYANNSAHNQTAVERQQPLAFSGISGWSSAEGFYFMVYDRRERRWVNPAMILMPLRESGPVQILSVELRNSQGAAVLSRNIEQGMYTVNVNAVTNPMPRTFLAPQRITSFVNGGEIGSLNFEAVSAREGVLLANRNGLVPVGQIYANFPAFEAAEVFLNRGQVTLEIIVQDIAGNSRSVIERLIVH